MSARDTIHHALVRRYGTSGPADVNAILTALSAAGFAVVPNEPTTAMLNEAQRAWTPGVSHYEANAIRYRAMIAAAKEPRP